MKCARLLLFVAMLSWLTQQYGVAVRTAVVKWRNQLASQNFQDQATRSAGYVIPADRWLEYEVAPNARQIRVLTNASLKELPPDDRQPDFERPGWRYSVAYQLIDKNGVVVQDSVYNFRATVSRFRHPTTKEIYSPFFYAKSSDIPTSTRTLQCPLEPLDHSIARIRLKLATSDPLINEVVCRVLNRVDRPDYADPTIWGRLSKQRRASLCRASVYGPELLTPSERRSILRWQWSVAPPIIDPNHHPKRRILYRLDEPPGEEVGAMTPPAGILVDRTLDGTFKLPPVPGVTHIEIERVERSLEGVAAPPIDLTMTLHERGPLVPISELVQVHSDIITRTIRSEAGILTFQADEPTIVRATWQDADGLEVPRLLHDERTSLRMYRLDAAGVRFHVSHLDDQPTPLRVDFRKLANTESNLATVHWRFIHKDKTHTAGTIDLHLSPSRFDSTTIRSTRYVVSHAEQFFWAIPSTVAEIQLSCDVEMMVAAFSRPPDVIRLIQSNSSMVTSDGEIGSLNRSWFVLRPIGDKMLQTKNRTTVIDVQARPPVRDTLLSPADYEWVSYRPSGLWRARRLLTPRDAHLPVRSQAEDVIFRRFHIGRTYRVSTSHPFPQPTVIFDNAQVGTEISIFANGREVQRHHCRSRRGEFLVEGLPSERLNTLEIRSDEQSPVYINHLRIDAAHLQQKRMAFRLIDGALEFNYDKRSSEEEVLSFRFFRSDAHEREARVQIEIPNLERYSNGPLRAWSWQTKQYLFERSDSNASLILDGTDGHANAGDLGFIRLGSDVPPGNYQIRISRSDRRDGYVVLYRTKAPPDELREIQIIRRNPNESIQ